ncbi:unnamed protein product [Chondrus crispus]|uniref:Oxysterol-binding protein n=1 Tax=Chondrus crispus TaxID=2769 RepID=R7Q9D8_CHOCR|nr:unnamed protein product [Chondrus crispus]CDF33976.1 unnamed protein product [Chondrus crispus]|eukprot:XP_005713795.1 unnamed protein product [Chondrus crispus]
MASSAYSTVIGPPPESFAELTPTTALTEGRGAPKPSTEFGNVDAASRQALWRQLASVVGMDVMNMRLSLPIWLFEPSTALTRMIETFEFSDLLDRAATSDDPVLRDCLVAAFVISAFSHTERVRKPFNPVLGESFEYTHPLNGMRFYAEQVEHHPPVSVSHCEGKGWEAGEVVDIAATFHGNSIEVRNVGSRYINLHKTGDRYSWTLPQALVSNLFVGGAFVDHFGTVELKNETTGTSATLNLTQCGWFSAGRYEVAGELLDSNATKIVLFKGAWNKFLDCERVAKAKGEGTNRLWMAGSHLLSEEEGGGVTGVYANCTKFTKKILSLHSDHALELPPNDSRFRPDRLALEKGNRTVAAEEKIRIEQMQRDRRAAAKKRVESGGGKIQPRYFRKVAEDKQLWEPIGNYWTDSRNLSEDDRKNMVMW